MTRATLPALATAVVLAACGGGSTPATHSGSATPSPTTTSTTASPATQRLSVSPPTPVPTSRVTFAFTAPATAGHRGASLISFTLTLTLAGLRHAGCIGPRTAPILHVVKGATASVQLGGPWCAGAYVARVQEFARPFCKPGQMCAQYVRLIGTVATARFRVS